MSPQCTEHATSTVSRHRLSAHVYNLWTVHEPSLLVKVGSSYVVGAFDTRPTMSARQDFRFQSRLSETTATLMIRFERCLYLIFFKIVALTVSALLGFARYSTLISLVIYAGTWSKQAVQVGYKLELQPISDPRSHPWGPKLSSQHLSTNNR